MSTKEAGMKNKNQRNALSCTQGFLIGLIAFSNFIHQEKSAFAMAMCPYIDIEATVVSLSLESPEGYYEDGKLIRAPLDSAVVRIDKVYERGGDGLFDWASLGIEEGKDVELEFKYSVRPAKIVTVVGRTIHSGRVVSHVGAPAENTFEDGYFVFREDGSAEAETILPGLQAGSRFRTKLWKTFEVKVGQYEVVH